LLDSLLEEVAKFTMKACIERM